MRELVSGPGMIATGSMYDWHQLIEERLQGRELPSLPPRIHVPRPPKCVAELIRLVDRPATPLSELAALIEMDSEIASSVLRLVNGSQMMLREKITSISRAIGIVGLRRCKMLVMSAAIQASMSGRSSSQKHVANFLVESQERALYARRVAELLGVDAEVAYISALLQDLLLPQLMHVHSQVYDNFRPRSGPLVGYESECLEWDHSIFTAALLSQWNFPEEVIACVAMHHENDTILRNEKLIHSEIAAVAVSGLLPGTFTQEPKGISLLLEYQNAIAKFDFLQVATDVDEEMSGVVGGVAMRVPLGDRLGRLALSAIEENHGDADWVEQTIGNYTLEEQIGQGGMGVVYRARHSMLRRPAAVKMLRSSAVGTNALERFEAEANITSELSSPHTVQVYDYGMTPDGALYCVMEYLEGFNLAELVKEHGPLPEGRIIHLLCQVCGSLAEAHSKGLVHRDIKPENIALTVCAGAHDFAKVLDFGLVAFKDEISRWESSQKLQGTPAYMAPEAIESPDSIDARTDLYALGAVAYFCLTGKSLFSHLGIMETLHAQISEIPDLSEVSCSEEFKDVVLQCLEKTPNDRPQSVIQLAQLMGECASSSTWTFSKAQRWWEENPVSARKSGTLDSHLSTIMMPSAHIDETKSFETENLR